MIIVSNPRGDQAVTVPIKSDRSRYCFEMICDNGARRVYADTYTELTEALIAGYDDVANNDEADELRLLYAVRIQVELQATLCAAHPTKLNDIEQATLLGDRHVPPVVGMWRSPVPLVLVETYYQPTGVIDRPIGRPHHGEADSNLIWLDPTDEQTLITSANAAGVISLAAAEH